MRRLYRDCVFCNKRLSPSGLQPHILSHIHEKPVLCQFCCKECSNGQTYQIHLKIYHPGELKKTLNCPFCNKFYTLTSAYKNHLSTHTGEKPYSCEICHKSFTNKTCCQIHVKSHFAKKVHGCELCPLKFAKLEQLRRHKVSVHERSYNLLCPMCPKRFHNMTILRSHINIHTNERAYKCSICNLSYKHSISLKQHYLIGHSGASYKVNCKICGAAKAPWNLGTHLATHIKPHKCPVCEKSFSKEPAMALHLKLHTERGQERFECKICKKSYDTLKGRNVHQLRHSSQYPCTVCGRVFNCHTNRNAHMKRHTKERLQACVFCEKRFSEYSILRRHLLQHIHEKPWLCNECSYEGRSSGEVKSHKRHNHNSAYKKPEKVHVCSICEMKFGWRGNLLRHLRFHTGEKPYPCGFCNKRYVKKLTLVDHVKKHHPNVNAE